MIIADEIFRFDSDVAFLVGEFKKLDGVEIGVAKQEHILAAEALGFRLFRSTERLIRAIFLESCVFERTPAGKKIESKIKCADHILAENILKFGKNFMDWGRVDNIRELSNLVFDNGFPMIDVISPLNSTLVDLHRIRNFIAHDSSEAKSGFEKVIANYLVPSVTDPVTAGELLLSRRAPNKPKVASMIATKVSGLTSIYLSL